MFRLKTARTNLALGVIAALAIASPAVAAPCETDTDCLSYEICFAFDKWDCPESGPACMVGESDEDCSVRAQEWRRQSCTGTSELKCVAQWSLACSGAEDCGEDFTCQDEGCRLIEEVCESSSDCPDGWGCESSALPEMHCYPSVAEVGAGGSTVGSTDSTVGSTDSTVGSTDSDVATESALDVDDESAVSAKAQDDEDNGGCSVGGALTLPGEFAGYWALLLGLGAVGARRLKREK